VASSVEYFPTHVVYSLTDYGRAKPMKHVVGK